MTKNTIAMSLFISALALSAQAHAESSAGKTRIHYSCDDGQSLNFQAMLTVEGKLPVPSSPHVTMKVEKFFAYGEHGVSDGQAIAYSDHPVDGTWTLGATSGEAAGFSIAKFPPPAQFSGMDINFLPIMLTDFDNTPTPGIGQIMLSKGGEPVALIMCDVTNPDYSAPKNE